MHILNSLAPVCSIKLNLDVFACIIMDGVGVFNQYVCESFFDFSRDLNGSNDIVEALYSLVIRTSDDKRVLFQGLERRLKRSSQECRNAEDFVKLTKTAFRHQMKTENKWNDIALLFFVGEWIVDQARLFISDSKFDEVKREIVKQMTIKLSMLQMKTRPDWYKLVVHEKKIANCEPEYDYFPLAASLLMTFIMNKLL